MAGKRNSRMATISENADIAVLQSQMKTLINSVDAISTKLDNQNSIYITRGEFTEFKSRWLFSHVIVALLTAIIVGLIEYFIIHHGG